MGSRTIPAFEAKAQFAALLEEVAAGGVVVITRHGRPIARLAQAGPEDRSEAHRAAERIRSARPAAAAVDRATILSLAARAAP
jgi:prevent-host-death family protein